MNSRITARERGLLKGAIRRAFSRSDLRRKVIDSVDLPEYIDLSRPRVKKWSRCPVCTKSTPKYLMIVDHIIPVIPVDTSFDVMSLDDVVDRVWCEEMNLQPICPECHSLKSATERKERKRYKKEREDAQLKRSKKAIKKRSPRNPSGNSNK